MIPTIPSVTKNMVLVFGAGVIVGALAYKYVKVEKKLNIDELTDNLKKLANNVASKGRGKGPNL
ncbi:MAG: hypothetical protein Q4E81_06305 [Succinatimonas sp.]|nr:hypothetical protein [Succinatimonas sp.]